MAWTALVSPITTLIGKFVEDKDKANELAHDIATMAENHSHAERVAQIQVNQQEAAHKSLFVAGWRPAVGWVCVAGLGWNFLIQPLLSWAVFILSDDLVPLAGAPQLDITDLLTLLGGMLGLSWMRSDEKKAGVARSK